MATSYTSVAADHAGQVPCSSISVSSCMAHSISVVRALMVFVYTCPIAQTIICMDEHSMQCNYSHCKNKNGVYTRHIGHTKILCTLVIYRSVNCTLYLPDCASDSAVNTVQSVYMQNTVYSALRKLVLHDTSNQ